MPVQFAWSDEYSVGHSAIDEQHRSLFEMGNAIANAQLDEAPYFIDKLYEYVRMHFEFEEGLMRSVKYPDLYRHIEIHNNLIAELHNFSRKPLENENDFHEFKKFLFSWIIDHIMREDKKYASYVKKMV